VLVCNIHIFLSTYLSHAAIPEKQSEFMEIDDQLNETGDQLEQEEDIY